MQLGIIGLGKMGGNMLLRLAAAGHDVRGFDRDPGTTARLAQEAGFDAPASVADLVGSLDVPRVVWLMLPAGDVTERAVAEVGSLLAPGDVIVDGANSLFKDSMRRAVQLAGEGIGFVDAGVSGGVWGRDNGYALMVGGSAESFAAVRPAIVDLAPARDAGWLHCGPAGSGHFVKMVHNGIEYGMMQAYAEGFALMKGREDFELDLAAIAEMWRHGSVVRSWLLDLTAEFLREDQELSGIEPVVADSGEGRWTVIEAIEQGIPAPAIGAAVMMRHASQGGGDYGNRILSMMRKGFGGHAVVPRDEDGE
jgi:6-phosphogluconate dehydrogenase